MNQPGLLMERQHLTETETQSPARLVVAIPSTSRPGILPDTVRALARQNTCPDLVVLSLVTEADMGDLVVDDLPFPVQVLYGPKGATQQRNRAFDVLGQGDIVLFLDDDFLLMPDFVENTAAIFADDPEVVMATGKVMADGIKGPGYDHPTGEALLAKLGQKPSAGKITPAFSGYGCNMAIRMAPVIDHEMGFDENLPLYSWLEDVDFTRRLRAYGKLVKSETMRGVHLGTKTGRTNGIPLGYSQVANPIYLFRKGSMTLKHTVSMIARNFLANTGRSLNPPAWTDYRGRWRGNMLAFRDLITGRISPAQILSLK